MSRTVRFLLVVAAASASGPATASNLLQNPYFTGNLNGWTPVPTGSFTHDSSSGYPGNGSAHGVVGLGETAYLSQCLPAVAGGLYDFHTYCRLPASQDDDTQCGVNVQWYTGDACAAGFLSGRWGNYVHPSGDWEKSAVRARAPGGVRSARVSLWNSAYYAGSGGSSAHFDGAYADLVVKGDLQNDDRADLLLRQAPPSNALSIWYMNGTVRASEGLLTPQQSDPFTVVGGIDEFTEDANSDIVFQHLPSGLLTLWAMYGQYRIGEPMPLDAQPASNQWRVAATGYFQNADGSADLVLRNLSTHKLEVWMMKGVHRVAVRVPTPDQATDANWRLAGASDYNQDGHADLLWYNGSTGKIVMWFLDEDLVRIAGQFTNPDSAGNSNWRVVASGDYGIGANGLPGTIDIVWRNGTSGKLVVWHMDAAGNRTAGAFTTPDAPDEPLAWSVVGPR